MSLDYSLEESTGKIVAHKPDCTLVRMLAEMGEPVFTMLDCARPLSEEADGIVFHSCLDE